MYRAFILGFYSGRFKLKTEVNHDFYAKNLLYRTRLQRIKETHVPLRERTISDHLTTNI